MKKLKTKICSSLGLKNIYCHNRFLKLNDSDNVEDYLNKYT